MESILSWIYSSITYSSIISNCAPHDGHVVASGDVGAPQFPHLIALRYRTVFVDPICWRITFSVLVTFPDSCTSQKLSFLSLVLTTRKATSDMSSGTPVAIALGVSPASSLSTSFPSRSQILRVDDWSPVMNRVLLSKESTANTVRCDPNSSSFSWYPAAVKTVTTPVLSATTISSSESFVISSNHTSAIGFLIVLVKIASVSSLYKIIRLFCRPTTTSAASSPSISLASHATTLLSNLIFQTGLPLLSTTSTFFPTPPTRASFPSPSTSATAIHRTLLLHFLVLLSIPFASKILSWSA